MTSAILHHPSSPAKAGMLLREAAIEQAALKAGLFGPQGSGKTLTAILIALGLSIRYHNKAPIAMLDTESGSDFVKPICDLEGVPLLVIKSRAFADMAAALLEAERRSCCAFIVDSYTHPWKELCDSFKARSNRNRLEFHHMDALKTKWEREWRDPMLNSPLHVLLCGRLGNMWGNEEDEDGEQKLVNLGTKMKGEAEAGYEPNLLLELEGIQDAGARVRKTRAKRGTITHNCYVLKDRWRALNGKTIAFRDLNDYKPGNYEPVFTAFLPHIQKLAIGSAVQRGIDSTRTSVGSFAPTGESAYQQLQKQKQIAIENLEGTFRAIWPGETGIEKALRRAAIEALFDTRSWTAVQDLTVEKLEHAHLVLRVVEGVIANKEHLPENAADVLKMFATAEQVIRDRNAQAQQDGVL